MLIHISVVEPAGLEIFIIHNLQVVRNDRFHTAYGIGLQGQLRARYRLLPRPCPDDQLGYHGIVVGRYLIAPEGRAVHSYADPARCMVLLYLAHTGGKVVRRVLRGYAALHGVAVELDILLLVLKGHACGYPYPLLYNIDAGYLLGHGVLHLNPGVHLHEVDVHLLVSKTLHRASVVVPYRLHSLADHAAHLRPLLGCEEKGGGYLDELLVPPLDGAVSFAEVDHTPVLVTKDLKFDVVRIHDQLL